MENQIIQGDALEVLKTLDSESVDCCITSPPYYALRDYGVPGQLGLEKTYQEYITKLCDIFDEVKRVLKKEGTCWVNIGDSYSNQKTGNTETRIHKKAVQNTYKKAKQDIQEKSLLQIPARFAIEMSNRGWILRNEIIWHKETCMPSSSKDRFTVDFEKVYFFVKSPQYYFEQQLEPLADSSMNDKRRGKIEYRGKWNGFQNQTIGKTKSFTYIDENGRNKRAVWTINPKPFKEAHFATYPEELIETPVKAGCPTGGVCLDPFMGAGTTAWVAKKLNRKYLGIELNPEYIKIAEDRIKQDILL